MNCKYCENEMVLVKMEMSNSTIAIPRFHHFHQCYECGWADKKWISIKGNIELEKSCQWFNEDIYDEWRNGQ